MPRFRFEYVQEAEDIEMAYEIARDNFGMFDVTEIDDDA